MTVHSPLAGADEFERPPWVLVSAGFHQQGGQSKANAALADYLLRRGHAVHLVAHDIDARLAKRAGVTLHVVSRPGAFDMAAWLLLDYRGQQVARAVTARAPRAYVVVNGSCCHWGDINWVHCVHHAWKSADAGAPLWFKVKNRLSRLWARRRERRIVRSARLVIANSEQTQRYLIEYLALRPERVRVIYLGAEAGQTPITPEERARERRLLGLSPDQPVVLFAGALGHDRNKGFDTLLRAWQDLVQGGNWDVQLLAAGSGTGSHIWQQRARAAGIADRVRFIGFTERMNELLAAVDLLVSPVRYEAYGLNVQEAICRGVPALVSARAGVVERYSPELAEAILPDPEDWHDLAERLRCWRADMHGWRERFQSLGDELRAYTWDRMAAGIVDLAEAASPV